MLGASAVPVSTLEPMATRAVETPIGTLGIDASEAGLRRVRLPGEHEAESGGDGPGAATGSARVELDPKLVGHVAKESERRPPREKPVRLGDEGARPVRVGQGEAAASELEARLNREPR